jgi:hypothetical protein
MPPAPAAGPLNAPTRKQDGEISRKQRCSHRKSECGEIKTNRTPAISPRSPLFVAIGPFPAMTSDAVYSFSSFTFYHTLRLSSRLWIFSNFDIDVISLPLLFSHAKKGLPRDCLPCYGSIAPRPRRPRFLGCDNGADLGAVVREQVHRICVRTCNCNTCLPLFALSTTMLATTLQRPIHRGAMCRCCTTTKNTMCCD